MARRKTDEVEVTTIPVFPNFFPYNELLFDEKLIAKSRNWEWKHRGPTLLYTSTRTEGCVARAYGFDPGSYPRKVIVGVGNLVDVRPFTGRELRRIFKQFNPDASREEITDYTKYGILWTNERITPGFYGYFFENLRRFEIPVPYNPPKGAVRTFRAPKVLVMRALREVGY